MTKRILLLLLFFFQLMASARAQTNLIQNPGFEATPTDITAPVGTPVVNHLFKVASNSALVTEIAQPTATSMAVTDGLWVKRQTVTSSSLQAYLASGGANGSATYLFLKIAGGNSTAGFDWTKMSAQQRVSLSNTTVYTFSFWAKVGNAVNTVYAYLADKTGDTGSATFAKSIPLTGGTAWTKYTVTFDIPAERAAKPALDYTKAYIGVGINALYTTATPPVTQNNWLYVDDFELLAITESLVPVITSATPENVYLKTKPIPVTITFNKSVTGFTAADLNVVNGTVTNFVALSPTVYTADILPQTTGKVTIDILAGAASDSNSNQCVASNQFVRFFNNENPTGNYGINTTICDVKDNKKAIYCFTADDGFTDAAVFFNNEFKRLNLCGSLALVANWINGAQTPASTYSFWNALLADGKIDVINHSKSHVKFSTISSLKTGRDSLYNEIIGNQTVFRTHFQGQQIITMANPAVVNTDSADVLIKKSHYAARNGGSGYNSLSPTENEWFKLNMLANYFSSKTRAAYATELNKYVDNVISNKQWLIVLAHGIGTAVNAMPDTAFTKHFEYVATKTADVWVAKFGDATRYIREKQNSAVLTVDSVTSKMIISVTHTLDATIFNYPLTLKTKVPDNWLTVSVAQNGLTQNISTLTENNFRYLYYNAVPNAGLVELVPIVISTVPILKKKSTINMAFNQTAGCLTISNPENIKYRLQIFNAAGMLCYTSETAYASQLLDVSSYAAGMYVLTCIDADGFVQTNKVIKN